MPKDCASVFFGQHVQHYRGDSRLVNISAGNGFLGLHDRKVTINMGSILNGYGDVGVL